MNVHGHTTTFIGKNGKRKVRKSLTYQSWSSANDRCYIESHRWFHSYGGRGIEVCEQWRRGTKGAFANFLAYLKESGIGERPSKELTLDRIRCNDNYEPGNIRWADKSEQRMNQERMQSCNDVGDGGHADIKADDDAYRDFR